MKRNLLALTVCSLIILIVWRFPTGQMRYSMELAFRAVIAVIMVGTMWRINRYIASFLALALFSQFYPMFCSESARAFYNVLSGVMLYYIIVTHGKDWVVHLMNMMCVVALVNIGLVTCQVLGFHPLWQDAGGTVTGFMENQNSLSASLALCFPAFLRGKWKWLSPLVLFGLFVAKSSGGIMAITFGLCFYFIVTAKERKQLYPIVMGLILISGIFVIFFDQYQSMDIRMNVWRSAWSLFTHHWLWGCGLGRWPTEFIVLASVGQFPEGFIRLHSTILQSMLELGIGFAVILAGYLINIARRSWSNLVSLAIPLTALIIIITNGSVNFLIRIAPNAALVIVWLAIMEISLRRLKDDRLQDK